VNGVILVTGAAGFAGSHVVEALGGPERSSGGRTMRRRRGIAHLAAWHRVDMLNLAEVRDEIARLKPQR
jgi:nucleoside-diphosphate-sugar epimerase